MTSSEKHIVLINGIYPPDRGASGEVANDLVGELIEKGLNVTVITTDRQYNAKPEKKSVNGKVIKTLSFAFGKGKALRLLKSICESFLLIQKAKRLNADFYIVCSDPPLLNWVSTYLLKKKKWVLWTMDLYPEAFVANELVGERHWSNKIYEERLKKIPPTAFLHLGEGQRNFIQKKYCYQNVPSFMISCRLKETDTVNKILPSWKNDTAKIYFAYCGNLGEAHSEDFLIDLVQYSNQQKHFFILSLFGTKAKIAKKRVMHYGNVEVVNWISDKDLNHIDIQIVTLKNKWTHVCVPSKAVSSVCRNTPIVYHGSDRGDIYLRYTEALWHIKDIKGKKKEQIIAFYNALTKDEIEKKSNNTEKIKINLVAEYRNSVERFAQFLKDE